MLLEYVEYPKKVPYNVEFISLAQEDFHYHNEMEILLVLRGNTSCKIHNVLYKLEEGDVLIVDTSDMHKIFNSSEDILLLSMHVDVSFFKDLYPDIDYMIFACEDYSKTSTLKHRDLQKKVSILKNNIAKTALAFMSEEDNTKLQMSYIDDLIFNLVNQFQGFFIEDYKFKADNMNPEDVGLNRLYKILKYIYLNYDKKITLNDLAEIVYLNPYYVSHLIKNTSGLSFQSFLNYVRLEYAEKMLVENKLTLTQISSFCGFSSLSYFNKCFKAWYKMSPSEYREQLEPCERTFFEPSSPETAKALLEEYLISRSQESDSELLARSSHHIFIPVKYAFRKGQDFKKSYPLRILISSQEDLFILNYRKEAIKALEPKSMVIDLAMFQGKQDREEVVNVLYALKTLGLPIEVYCRTQNLDEQTMKILNSLNIPFIEEDCTPLKSHALKNISTASAALEAIIKDPFACIHLSGKENTLLTPGGLLTPLYMVSSIFSKMNGIVTEHRNQYMIVKELSTVYILVHLGSSDSGLKAHLFVNDLPGSCTVIKRTFTKKHSCFEIIKNLDKTVFLDDETKDYINHLAAGNIDILPYNGTEVFEIDLNLEPETFILVEIKA